VPARIFSVALEYETMPAEALILPPHTVVPFRIRSNIVLICPPVEKLPLTVIGPHRVTAAAPDLVKLLYEPAIILRAVME
jgi:hypothetical protein